MLPCTLIHKNTNMTNIDWEKIGNNQPNENFKFDIFFQENLLILLDRN